MTPALAGVIVAAGAVAGTLGTLLGIGGGVFLVPFLHLVLNIPTKEAAAISLTTVIATSSAVSAGQSGKNLINLRFAMLLEVATVGGSLLAGVTSEMLDTSTLDKLFAAVAVLVAGIMLTRLDRRNVILNPDLDPGLLGGRFHEEESGGVVAYRVKRLPIAIVGSFIAGNVSYLLGIGGGVIKVPILNAWCGVPLRPAAATSAFMIGVTATTGAIIYYGHGQLRPALAAAAVLGVQLGSWAAFRIGPKVKARRLKLLMAMVLMVVAALMFSRGMEP
jgi:uncharacterized membrane protein YfcA